MQRAVIFHVGAPNNAVEEAQCGLTIPPRDSETLTEAVTNLYRMFREEREAMGRRGREYVEEHHDIAKLAARLEGILKQIS